MASWLPPRFISAGTFHTKRPRAVSSRMKARGTPDCVRSQQASLVGGMCPSSAPILRRHFRDQPRTALERQIVPEPGEGDDEAIAQADQEVDVRHGPEHPANETLEVDAA